jgi:hypothetical protein
MFIRRKDSCYYLVENHRVNGKVRQKIVAYMGRDATIEDRLCSLSQSLSSLKGLRFLEQPRKPGRSEHRSIVERPDVARKAVPEDDPRKSNNGLEIAPWSRRKRSAYTKAEHEEDLQRCDNQIAHIESQLAKLWALVPSAERAKVRAYIKKRASQIEEEHLEALRGLAEILKGVVPR